MVNLGELIGGENAKGGFFLEFKIHWGDIAKEILAIDSSAIHHMTMDDWKKFIEYEVKQFLKLSVKFNIETSIHGLVRSIYLKQKLKLKEIK